MRHKQRPIKSSHKSVTFIASPQLRKHFEHNYIHMSDVMRLAFLENNDISIDDCANVDFNSFSTASILQRNIQQQLQQQRRDLLQLRQQQRHHDQLQLQLQQQLQQQEEQQQLQQQRRDLLQLRQQQRHHDMLQIQLQQQLQQQQEEQQLEQLEQQLQQQQEQQLFQEEQQQHLQQQLQRHHHQPQPQQQHHHHNQHQQQHLHQQHKASSASRQRGRARDSGASVATTATTTPRVKNEPEGFLCDEPGCGKSFPSLRKLRHHKVVHSDEFPFVCEFEGCGKKFKRKFGIDLHSTTHFDLDPAMYSKTSNNSSLPFFGRRMQYSMCKQCNQKFKTVHEYQYHMLKHGKEPFKCPVKGCGQTFGIWKSFQKHRASHYFNYFCKMDKRCDHHTSNLQLLKLHIYCCHFRRKLPKNATNFAKPEPTEEDDDEMEEVDDGEEMEEVDDGEEMEDVEDGEELEEVDDGEELVDDVEDQEPHYRKQQEQDQEPGELKPEVSNQPPEEQQSQLQEPVEYEEAGQLPDDVATPRRDSRLRRNPPRSSKRLRNSA